jgi:hypothetical protein
MLLQPGMTMTAKDIVENIPTSTDHRVVHSSMNLAVENGAVEKIHNADGTVSYHRRTPAEFAAWSAGESVPETANGASVFLAPEGNSEPAAESVNDSPPLEFNELPTSNIRIADLADAVAGMARQRLQLVPESPEGFACALFSDGRFMVELDGTSLTLSKEHTDRMLHYLDRMTP